MVGINEVPQEIFIAILSFVDTYDLIECILVNQKWHQLISNTILYQELSFTESVSEFRNALKFFDARPFWGECVRHLELKNFEIESDKISLLAKYFPNLKSLIWTDRCPGRKPEPVPVKWTKLKSIYINIINYPYMIELIDESKFANLTDLYVSFNDLMFRTLRVAEQDTVELVGTLARVIIQHIGTFHGLKNLALSGAVVDLNDLETLHQNCPTLYSLNLNDVYVNNTITNSDFHIGNGNRSVYNIDGVEIGKQPATSLKALFIKFALDPLSELHSMDASKKIILQWLIYISCKFTNLISISIPIASHEYPLGPPLIPEFEAPLIRIICNTTNLIYYDVGLYPCKKSIIKAMDDSNGKLEGMHARIDAIEDMREMLSSLENSKQVTTIKSLRINGNSRLRFNSDFTPILLKVYRKLPCLTRLVIDTANFQQETLIDIIKEMPTLQELDLNSVSVTKDENNVLPVIKESSQLRSINIVMFSPHSGTHQEINRLFKIMFQACPLLEEFHIWGSLLCGFGTIELPLHENLNLLYVKVNLLKTEYYTFSNDKQYPGAKWADWYTLIDEDDISNQSFHINITCLDNVEFDLDPVQF